MTEIFNIPRAVVRGGTLPLRTYKKMAVFNKCNYIIPVKNGVRVIHYQHPEIKHIICNSFVDDLYPTKP